MDQRTKEQSQGDTNKGYVVVVNLIVLLLGFVIALQKWKGICNLSKEIGGYFFVGLCTFVLLAILKI